MTLKITDLFFDHELGNNCKKDEKGGHMECFEYEITRHSADTFEKVIYFCSESGQCGIDEVSKDQTRILADILNNRGSKGWELVQISFGKDGVMAFWKRRIKDKEKYPFAS